MSDQHTPQCFARHIGLWAIDPTWMNQAMAFLRDTGFAADPHAAGGTDDEVRVSGGIAVIPIHGAMVKGRSKFGGADTLAIRRAVETAARDASISGIMLDIDSPGGRTSGVKELADAVADANKTKPVYAQVSDVGASAAYWVASQARQIFANDMASVGSIGVYAALTDQSKRAEMQGVKVHVISTGGIKGAGVPGAPVTDEAIAEIQERVDDINAFFTKAIAKGRSMPIADVRKLADGRMMIAAKAQAAGLIDGVQTMEQTFRQLRKEASGGRTNTARAIAMSAGIDA